MFILTALLYLFIKNYCRYLLQFFSTCFLIGFVHVYMLEFKDIAQT